MPSPILEHDGFQDEPTEQTRFLSPINPAPDAAPSSPVNRSTTVVLIAVIALVLDCGTLLIANPQTRLFESITCRKYYDDHDANAVGRDGWVPEHLCKIEPVESSVALLLAWQEFFDNIPSLLLAIPYGWLADKYGRKPIILATVVSFWVRCALIMIICYFWQTLPLKLVWATSVHAVFGGGLLVATNLALTMISDLSTEAQRALSFLRLGAVTLFANFVSPPLSALLMKYNLWIPMLLGLFIQFISIPLAIFIPETLAPNPTKIPSAKSAPAQDAANASLDASRSKWHYVLLSIKSFTDIVFRDWRIPPLILTYFLPAGVGFTILYMSKRYQWSIADVTLLLSVRSGISILVFLLLLPTLSGVLMQRFAFAPLNKDLWLGRLSCLLIVLGYAVFGFAPNIALSIAGMILFTLGDGYPILIRSLLTGLVERNQVARLYTIMSIVSTVGSMLWAPLLAGLFQEGSQLGDVWVGLPYFLVSGLFICASFLLSFVGSKEFDKKPNVESVNTSEEEEGPSEDST